MSKLNLILRDDVQTMSSKDISGVIEVRHDSVKRTMERLRDRGLITFTPMEETFKGADGKRQKLIVYHVNKRDSYVVVARLSPEFTARLVDWWMQHEERVRQPLTSEGLLQESNRLLKISNNMLVEKLEVIKDCQVNAEPISFYVGAKYARRANIHLHQQLLIQPYYIAGNKRSGWCLTERGMEEEIGVEIFGSMAWSQTLRYLPKVEKFLVDFKEEMRIEEVEAMSD